MLRPAGADELPSVGRHGDVVSEGRRWLADRAVRPDNTGADLNRPVGPMAASPVSYRASRGGRPGADGAPVVSGDPWSKPAGRGDGRSARARHDSSKESGSIRPSLGSLPTPDRYPDAPDRASQAKQRGHRVPAMGGRAVRGYRRPCRSRRRRRTVRAPRRCSRCAAKFGARCGPPCGCRPDPTIGVVVMIDGEAAHAPDYRR